MGCEPFLASNVAGVMKIDTSFINSDAGLIKSEVYRMISEASFINNATIVIGTTQPQPLLIYGKML